MPRARSPWSRAASDKPVLGAWLGARRRATRCRARSTAGGVANFYTPENAVDAFSFLAAYRRNQAWLLEVPPPQPEPEPLDLVAAERMRVRLAEAGRAVLARDEIGALLAAFGIAMTPCAIATTRSGARGGRAPRCAFRSRCRATRTAATRWTRTVRTRAALASAWRELDAGHSAQGGERPRVVVEKLVRGYDTDIAIGVATDPKFGPVVAARLAAGACTTIASP